MRKWGYGDQDITCICGQEQAMSHLLVCPQVPSPWGNTRFYDKQPQGGEYGSILVKRKYIINMQCTLPYTYLTIILVCYYYLYFT